MKKQYDLRKLHNEEEEVIEKAGAVADAFAALPPIHPSDMNDVVFHVHAIQNIVLARAAYKKDDRV